MKRFGNSNMENEKLILLIIHTQKGRKFSIKKKKRIVEEKLSLVREYENAKKKNYKTSKEEKNLKVTIIESSLKKISKPLPK